VGFRYTRATWFFVVSGKEEQMDDKTRPSDPCMFFADALCQEGCWLWDMDGAPGECSAFAEFPEAKNGPRDFYNRMLMEAMAS